MKTMQYEIDPAGRAVGISDVAIAEVEGLTIEESHPELERLKKEAASRIVRLTDLVLNANPVLQSYRDMVKAVGRSPKKFGPSAESLIHRVRRLGTFPRINTAVDSYNLIAARDYLALGVHDVAKITERITFRLSDGNDPFIAVGTSEVRQTQKGDYVYADENRVLAWLDSRDSDEVKLSMETTRLIMVIQGTPFTSRDYKVRAATDAAEMICRFCGGSYHVRVVP